MNREERRPVLLAVFAHPDDETCGPGGTLARYAAEGVDVAVLSVTRGDQGFCRQGPVLSGEALARQRLHEFRHATRALAVRQALVWDWPDGGLAGCPAEPCIAELARLILNLRPDVLLTWSPAPWRRQEDHATIGRLGTLAARAAASGRPPGSGPALRSYRVPRAYYLPADGDLAARLHAWRLACIDVDPYLQAKRAALLAYDSQRCCTEHVLARLREASGRTETFIRAWPRGGAGETDLFAGLRPGDAEPPAVPARPAEKRRGETS